MKPAAIVSSSLLVRVDRPYRPHIEKLAEHLLIYVAYSTTQASILTNSQKSWSGYRQHLAATISHKRPPWEG